METRHLFEEGYYFIGNKAVAKSFMFNEIADCEIFKSKIEHHLSPLCDVLAFGFMRDEFQLVIKVKERKVIEDYYLKKYEHRIELGDNIPDTTYIFAQAMANMQSGYVKFFNYKYDRDGGLMKGRYFRQLLTSEAEVNAQIESIHKMNEKYKRASIWTFQRKERGFFLEKMVNSVKRSSKMIYENKCEEAGFVGFRHKDSIDMRGQFDSLPPYSIPDYNAPKKIANLVKFMLLRAKS